MINRGSVGLTVRIYRAPRPRRAVPDVGRDARAPGCGDRHQSVETVTVSYNFLGHTRFGAVEWRPAELQRPEPTASFRH